MPAIRYRENVYSSDCDNIRRIVASSGFFSPEEIRVAVELAEERMARGAVSGYDFLFAEQSGRVIGYTCYGLISCTQASYDLYWIAVLNDFRGAGLGKQLLGETENLVRAKGGARIYVETSSKMQYRSTRSFYEKCGYRQEALLVDFYAPGDSKVIYVKVL